MNIKELQDHYNISRSTVYQWLAATGIETLKDERNRTYIKDECLSELDDLSKHLKEGGTLKNYKNSIKAELIETTSQLVVSSDDKTTNQTVSYASGTQLELFEKLEFLADKIAEKIVPPNPIEHWKSINYLAKEGINIPSSDVEKLTGTKPKGTIWTRGSFTFTKVGKIGNQSQWKITKN